MYDTTKIVHEQGAEGSFLSLFVSQAKLGIPQADSPLKISLYQMACTDIWQRARLRTPAFAGILNRA
jgi:hypothetical protein